MSILRVSVSLLLLFVSSLQAGLSYEHLDWSVPKKRSITESDYYIVFLCTARHLDYQDSQQLLRTLVKHAAGGKNADVGHSWILIHGERNGKQVTIEGGQSGELGIEVPKYYDGVMNYHTYGYPNPTREQKKNPRHEPDPIRYLWADVNDGFWQRGNGSFRPTFAAKVDMSKEEFDRIYEFIHPQNYDYRFYSLVGQQCSSYLAKIAELIGFPMEHQVTVTINPEVKMWRQRIRLWQDPRFSEITFSSPDVIERSLMEAVRSGRAEYALTWYRKEGRRLRKMDLSDRRDRQRRFWESVWRYPARVVRAATV